MDTQLNALYSALASIAETGLTQLENDYPEAARAAETVLAHGGTLWARVEVHPRPRVVVRVTDIDGVDRDLFALNVSAARVN